MSGWTAKAEGDGIWKPMMKGGKSACYSQSEGSGKIRDVRWESEEALQQSRTESFITCSVWKWGKCQWQPLLARTKVRIICSKYLKGVRALCNYCCNRNVSAQRAQKVWRVLFMFKSSVLSENLQCVTFTGQRTAPSKAHYPSFLPSAAPSAWHSLQLSPSWLPSMST